MSLKKLPLLLLVLSISCSKHENLTSNTYPRWVGDSNYNPEIDAKDFKPCHGDENIYQYFNLSEGPQYLNEKPALVRVYKENYQALTGENQNGMIRIRFVVNCEGKAGRFRMLQSDFDYNEVQFDKRITSQLLNTTTSIEDWQILYKNDTPIDYYMYLIFKLDDGQLNEILP